MGKWTIPNGISDDDLMVMRNRLRYSIRTDCERMQKANALPQNERAGKYRKAIEDLTDLLISNGETLLRIEIFGFLSAPLGDPKFMELWLDGWLASSPVQRKIRSGGDLLRRGDADEFFALCENLRSEEVKIIVSYGKEK